MIFRSFLIHSDLPLDLINTAYSLVSTLFLVTPTDCINWMSALSGCCYRKRSRALVDIGLVTCHWLGAEAYLVPTYRYSRDQWTEHRIGDRDRLLCFVSRTLKSIYFPFK